MDKTQKMAPVEEEEDREDEASDDEADEEAEDEADGSSAHGGREEEEDEEEEEEEEEERASGDDEAEDPSWWLPHAVLGGLVLVGVLGFFGVFNKPLGFLAARPAGSGAAAATTAHADHGSKPGVDRPATAAPRPPPSTRPTAMPRPPMKEIPAPADVAAPPADAQKTPTGLAYKVLSKGTGTEKPKPESRVKVHYSGWTKDGKMFDSSVARDKPAEFAVRGVIPGWTEGLQLMVVGDKVRFWIPGDLAYGETPKRPGAPAGQLTFDVELLEIK